MSTVAKWALLGAGAVVLIGLVFALPFVGSIDLNEFSANISTIVNVCGDFFSNARGLINNFLTPVGRTILTGLMGWLFGKRFLMVAIQIVTWAYHFIFRG